jgi:hypothetical protein
MTEPFVDDPGAAPATGSRPDNSGYLTAQEFCNQYRVARRTAERWRVTGDGPQWVRVGPRRIVYRLSDCEAWAARRTFAHRADELSRSDGRAA